jgi:hypothetical protein
VKDFYLRAVANRKDVDQAYALFIERKYKPLKLCSDQLKMQEQSYKVCDETV